MHFNGKPQNIGVLLGEPSGWLIDVDLDHALAIEKAAEYLPPTPLRFGRKSKPESHWIYRVRGTVATKQYRSKSAGTIVELRSTGHQTVFPPSTHESGERIEFVDPLAEPAEVGADELWAAVAELANAVKIQLGEKSAPGRERPAIELQGRRSFAVHPLTCRPTTVRHSHCRQCCGCGSRITRTDRCASTRQRAAALSTVSRMANRSSCCGTMSS